MALHITETPEIEWKRVGIEATAIIVSILLAFSIQAWLVSDSDALVDKGQ